MAQLDLAYNTLDADNDDVDFGTFAPVHDSTPNKKLGNNDINDLILARDNEMKKAPMSAKQTAEALIPQGIPNGIPVIKPQVQKQQVEEQPRKSVQKSQYYDADVFNKQFEQQQMANAYLKQMQQQQNFTQQLPQVSQEPGYFEKLFSKKKEFFKLVQWVLIVVLAISLHFFIDHYIKNYLTTSDLSPEREFLIRALYPLGILFVLWNLRVFSVKP